MKCKMIVYSGQVQGVGFRRTAQAVAEQVGVKGYVKNLSDGRVEMVVQGEESAIDQVLAGVERFMGRYIKESQIEELEVQQWSDFSIRY